MAHRIEVGLRPDIPDAVGNKVKARIKSDLGMTVDDVRIINAYVIDDQVTNEELPFLAKEAFSDPIIEVFSVNRPLADDFDWVLEVGFRPGVTDNVGRTSKVAIEDALQRKLKGEVYTSRQYLIKGDIKKKDVEDIASKLLANTLIERWVIKSKKEWDFRVGIGVTVPKVTSTHQPVVDTIDLSGSDPDLLRISKERTLALSLTEMRTVRDHFKDPLVMEKRTLEGLGPNPTDVELELLAQTWSEHCKHKIFDAKITYTDKETGKTEKINSLFKTYVKGTTKTVNSPFLVSVFHDNAGVISFNKEYNIVMKAETHNSPSALDPYGGALTGIVGVNRDPLGTGLGCRLIFNTDVFCFASPFYSGKIPPKLLHPKRVREGVRTGVEHGGNKSGIPTVNGSLVFHERFLGKPLVYCGTGGLMPKVVAGRPSHVKVINPGDLCVMTGGKIGKDGIHGATFSSEELHAGSPATAVQIGDPITQKKMADFIIEARDLNLYNALTDDGAGGLGSSVGETATYSGGATLDLQRAPLKYAGLDPWEILESEAQERMTLAVDPAKLSALETLAKDRDVEMWVLGNYTKDGFFRAKWGEKTVALIDMKFLHEGLEQMDLNAVWTRPKNKEPKPSESRDHTKTLLTILGRLNVCSKEYVVRQYDHEVQGMSVVKPLTGCTNDGPSDAAVLKPLTKSNEGIVVAHGICPKYSDIDTYDMTACAIDEALRSHVSVGGDPDYVAGLDNFCWCDPVKSEKTPDGEYKLAQLVRANKALFDVATEYKIPLISGKDSMKNDYSIEGTKISIPPTILFSTLGKIEDVNKAVTMDLKKPGDLVYVLGITKDELGGSEYYDELGYIGNNSPKVEPKAAMDTYRKLHGAMKKGLISSCHDVSDGGLAVALAETAFAGCLGLEADLGKAPNAVDKADKMLFSESASRLIVSIPAKNKAKFEKEMKGCAFGLVGKARKDKKFSLKFKGKVIVKSDIAKLKDAWQETMRW